MDTANLSIAKNIPKIDLFQSDYLQSILQLFNIQFWFYIKRELKDKLSLKL